MKNPARRTTQSDVAKVAGVNRATVSLALSKHPGIPEKTRTRIEAIALKLGYVPDPMLAALASYRNSMRPSGYRGTLAWFAETAPDYRWRDVDQFVTYLSAARNAAKRLGYQVEVFDVSEMGVTWSRAAAIAQARGIRGILVCPQPHANTNLEAFPWDRFSAVTFGYSLTRPLLHSVTAAHYVGVRQLMHELHVRGYRRIGCAIRPEHDSRIMNLFTAGFLTAGHLLPSLRLLDPCPDDGHYDGPRNERAGAGTQLQAWLEKEQPDALITGTPAALPLLAKWGVKIPGSLGLACASIAQRSAKPSGSPVTAAKSRRSASSRPKAEADLSGIVEDDERIGEAAVDLLVAMIQRGERGIPEKPQRVLITGHWHEGNTVRTMSSVPR